MSSVIRRTTTLGVSIAVMTIVSACDIFSPQDNQQSTKQRVIVEIPENIGGANAVANTTTNAFSLPSASMPLTERLNFSVGNSFFRNPWVTAPSSTTARDGLGPYFNTNACQNCHIKDGRGHLPASDDDNHVSLLVRLSIGPSSDPKHSVLTHPILGEQLQDMAIPGLEPEAKLSFKYQYQTQTLSGDEKVELRKPIAVIENTIYDAPLDNLQTSVRIAPAMIGLGYLAALSNEQILANADPDDLDKDGISGKANTVWNLATQSQDLGRFGWKAGQPNLKQQNASAFSGDMGLTSSIVAHDDCTQFQTDCTSAINGGSPEVSDKILDRVTFYTANLAVPLRRINDEATITAGAEIFQTIGCADCHKVSWQTPEVPDMPWLSNQTIYPFTDLLLHDMGEGLADHRSEFNASGTEWRTAPLWGIGLTSTVNSEFGFLHDGRARNLTEAIVWHGGEAQTSQQAFVNLPANERKQLLAFLNSL
ncbi:di-heme oxidoreductase family protein [Sessilibacter sp. MAH4]